MVYTFTKEGILGNHKLNMYTWGCPKRSKERVKNSLHSEVFAFKVLCKINFKSTDLTPQKKF